MKKIKGKKLACENLVWNLILKHKEGIEIKDIIYKLTAENYRKTREEIEETLEILFQKSAIFQPKKNFVKIL